MFRIAVFALAVASANQAVFAATFRVGQGTGCTHSALQSAINAAAGRSGEDTIRVNAGWLGAAHQLSISGQDLTIIGGHESCTDTQVEVSDRTVVSGAGGDPVSVFTIRGPGVVTLENLNIVDGDSLGDGGGVDYRGADQSSTVNVLEFRNVVFQANSAGASGGGLSATSGTAARPEVFLHENVAFLDNVAAVDGGALFLSGDMGFEAQGPGLYFHRNIANVGGAVAVLHPVRADIGSQDGSHPVFLDNRARVQGGAVAVVGPPSYSAATAVVRLFGTNPFAPMTFYSNESGGRGGALFVTGYSGSTYLCVHQVAFDSNMAPDGAFVYLDGGTLRYGNPSACGPLPIRAALSCHDTWPCNRIQFHQTPDADASRKDTGALIAVGPGADGRFDNVLVSGNNYIDEALVRIDASATAWFRQSVIQGNIRRRTSAGGLFQQRGNAVLSIESSTVAGNLGNTATPMPLVVQENLNGLVPLVHLSRSIVANPVEWFVFRIDSVNASPMGSVSNILALGVSEQFVGHPSVVEGDPQFVDGLDGLKRLAPSSPAVDFAPASDADPDAKDFDGMPRAVDLGTVPNRFGSVDLGAFELQQDDRFLFHDGFEGSDAP